MFSSFPAAWVLVALPFLSALVISQIRPLRELALTRHRRTWPVGIAGLVLLFAELIGALPAASALPVIFLAGTVSGFSLFWPLREERGGFGESGRRHGPPVDDPPRDDGPPRPGQRCPDWERVDRHRADWDRPPSRAPRPTRHR